MDLCENLEGFGHKSVVEELALTLLNTPTAIVKSPTITADEESKTYLVAGGNKGHVSVTVGKKDVVKCSCKAFRLTKGICAHLIAVAELNGCLDILVK